MPRRPPQYIDRRATQTQIAALVAAVEEGASLRAASAAVGLPYSTAKQWLRRGNDALDAAAEAAGDDDPFEFIVPRELPFARYACALEQARATSQIRRIRRLEKHAEDGNWLADAWALERMHPLEFSLVPARFAEKVEQPQVKYLVDESRPLPAVSEQPALPEAEDTDG